MGARDAASPVRSLDVARARATWTALDEAIRGDAGAWTFDDDDDDARAMRLLAHNMLACNAKVRAMRRAMARARRGAMRERRRKLRRRR